MNAIYLLGTWGKLEPDRYKAWVERSQGLDERLARAELLQTLLEAIEERRGMVVIDADDEWFVSITYRATDEQDAEASDKDLGLALLSAYTKSLKAGRRIGGGA